MLKSYKINGLDCAGCAAKLEKAIRKIEGINDVSINFLSEKITLDADENRMEEIIKEASKTCRKLEPDCSIQF